MKKTMFKRGFTLIELLVVIAIIGILAAVVLASLNDARDSGTDASIKQSVGNARSQAEIVYNQNSFSYESVCGAGTTTYDPKVKQLVDAASASAGVADADRIENAAFTAGQSICRSSDTEWLIAVPLVGTGTTNDYWCADSAGRAELVEVADLGFITSSGDYTCITGS